MTKEYINNKIFSYYKIKFAILSKAKIFDDLCNSVIEGIKRFGFSVEQYCEMEKIGDDINCVIVVNPIQFPKPKNKNIVWLAIQTEQMYSVNQVVGKWAEDKTGRIIELYKCYNAFFDFSSENVRLLNAVQNKAYKYNLCPPLMNNTSVDDISVNSKKKYDVVFIGTLKLKENEITRRTLLYDCLKKRYNVYPNNIVFDKEKDDAIKNSKICINLHYDESRYCEFMRIIDFVSNGAFLLTERMYDTEPFVEGEDYDTFYLTNMCEKIDYYLSHDDERNRIRLHAYEKYCRMNNDENIKKIIDVALLNMRERQYLKEIGKTKRQYLMQLKIKRTIISFVHKLKNQ